MENMMAQSPIIHLPISCRNICVRMFFQRLITHWSVKLEFLKALSTLVVPHSQPTMVWTASHAKSQCFSFSWKGEMVKSQQAQDLSKALLSSYLPSFFYNLRQNNPLGESSSLFNESSGLHLTGLCQLCSSSFTASCSPFLHLKVWIFLSWATWMQHQTNLPEHFSLPLSAGFSLSLPMSPASETWEIN